MAFFGNLVLGDIRKALDSQQGDELFALDFLKALNSAGLDTKGQISLAHGQAGVDLGVSVGVDFGAMLVPFVHLEVGASLGGGLTADGLLLVQRMPAQWWAIDVVQPQQAPRTQRDNPLPPTFRPPDWSSRQPLAMAYLRGRTFHLDAAAAAKAWVGVGTFDDQDETGATLGVKVEGAGKAIFTRLTDRAPSHYPPMVDSTALRDAVDDLFDANLKARAAAWLLGTAGGVSSLVELGVPDRSRGTQVDLAEQRLAAAKAKLKRVGKVALKGVKEVAKSYDELAIPDHDSVGATGVGETALRALRKAGRAVRELVRQRNLKTALLVAQLRAVRNTLEPFVKWLDDPAVKKKYGADVCKDLADLANRRIDTAARLRAALERRAALKAAQAAQAAQAVAPAMPAAAATGTPAFSLDITSVEAQGAASASAKLVLPRDKVKLQVAAGAEARFRRNAFRYQAWVPGPPGRLLRCTQDTVVTYVSRVVKAEGSTKSRSFSKERSNLVTMSYRSVHAQWFDNGMAEAGKAQPNGSGVSFGMSVLAGSLGAYVRCCKYLKDDPSHPEATLDDGLTALEAALMKQLRLPQEDLRRFMRNAPSGLADVVLDPDEGTRIESYLVEAAFAVTKPVDLAFDTPKTGPKVLKDLFELPDVAALITTGKPGSSLRLQVIRLRYRIQTGREKGVDVLSLGWNPQPWGEDSPDAVGDEAESWFKKVTGFDPSLPDWMKVSALAIEVGVEVEAVRRVACEGVFDLYTHYVPAPYSHAPAPEGYGRDLALRHELARRRELPDMLVPPVALFRQ